MDTNNFEDDDQPSKILNDFRRFQSKIQVFSFFSTYPVVSQVKQSFQLPVPRDNIDFMTVSIDHFYLQTNGFTYNFQIYVEGAEGPYLTNGTKSQMVAIISPDPNVQAFTRYDYDGDYQVRFQSPKQGYINFQLARLFDNFSVLPIDTTGIFSIALLYSIYYYYK